MRTRPAIGQTRPSARQPKTRPRPPERRPRKKPRPAERQQSRAEMWWSRIEATASKGAGNRGLPCLWKNSPRSALVPAARPHPHYRRIREGHRAGRSTTGGAACSPPPPPWKEHRTGPPNTGSSNYFEIRVSKR